ncbi:hypothetical protein UWK_01418 [Desulfocapsa sulfexigens DSM 10523]|uniref:Uncharacterized protein n=1 Tax=Desulfocapsa sulfexigens (strain DSM 10523 / SB164P1) TaxID=1167006 RepID=M1P3F6_DESSD|nr:hypothetical protein UWK_01418 [Desulfocapsa sulfexigens DSM 10523]
MRSRTPVSGKRKRLCSLKVAPGLYNKNMYRLCRIRIQSSQGAESPTTELRCCGRVSRLEAPGNELLFIQYFIYPGKSCSDLGKTDG